MVKMLRANHQGAALEAGKEHERPVPHRLDSTADERRPGERCQPRQLRHEQPTPTDLLAQGSDDAGQEAGRDRDQRLSHADEVPSKRS
jgi:hypothetical protein